MRVLIAIAMGLVVSAARAETPDGIWLVEHKAAVRLYACEQALCGSVVWLRRPSLRTSGMCGRVIIWGLQPTGAGRWGKGWFHDPENDTTYHVSATQVSPDEIAADVYPAISWLGETVDLLRIQPGSLNGWCG